MNTEDYEGAATAFEHVLKAEPNIFDAHIFLIVAYAKLDRTQDEIRECQTVLKTLPDNFGANVNLGRALAKTGDFANAVAPLQKAISLAPDRPQPHLDLADVYDKLGKPDDANRERAEAERLGAVRRGAAQTPPGDNQSHPQ
jgi:uncharacterized protein HemY